MEHEIPEQIKQSINEIVELLKSGDLPEVIAKITFPKDHKVMNNWSHSNKLLAYIDWIYANTDYGKLTKEERGKKFFNYLSKAVDEADYRGFQQWKKEKHAITKGETASYILGPLTSKGYHRYYTDGEERKYLARGEKAPEGKNEEKEEYTFIKGFKLIPVFDVKQTTGPALKYEQLKLPEFPFLDVAKDMGIKVIPKGFDGGYYGAFSQSENKIIICTPDEVTFFHELSHAVDNKLQKEKTGKGLMGGQHADQEVVAQFSANVLAHYLGREIKQTTAYTLKYLEHYAGDKYEEMLMKVMSRCEAVIDYITNYKQAKSPAVQNKEMSGGIKQEAEVLADKKIIYCEYHRDTPLDQAGECPECEKEILEHSKLRKEGKAHLSPLVQRVVKDICPICKTNMKAEGKNYCQDCIEQKQPEEKEYLEQIKKEEKEHPTLPKETIETIVRDHKIKGLRKGATIHAEHDFDKHDGKVIGYAKVKGTRMMIVETANGKIKLNPKVYKIKVTEKAKTNPSPKQLEMRKKFLEMIRNKANNKLKEIKEELHVEKKGDKWFVTNEQGTKIYFKTNNYSSAEDWISTWGNKQ